MKLLEITSKELEDMIQDLRYVNKFYLANPTPDHIRALRINTNLIRKTEKELEARGKIIKWSLLVNAEST